MATKTSLARPRSFRMKLDPPHARAALGFLVWLASPWIIHESFASLRHLVLFVPLVTFSLTVALVDAMLARHRDGLATHLQPIGAACALASFVVAPGPLAGAIAAGWLCVALLTAARALRRARAVGLVAAHVFLIAGAVWLVLARAGASPFSFASVTVHLAALHFHVSGFTLQVLLAAMGRRLKNPRMAGVHRIVTRGAIAAIPLIAIGNAALSPNVKLAGVMMMTACSLVLVPLTFGVSCAEDRVTKTLLRTSAVSLGVAMLVAGAYGLTEHAGRPFITVEAMARTHGLMNAVGFMLCALLGHVRIVKAAHMPVCRKDVQPSSALARLTPR